MRKGFCWLLLLCFMWALPALGEAYTDMAALSAAVAATKEDTTFTLGADLTGEAKDCVLANRSKAVITIDGQGHAIDSLIFDDGTFVLQNAQLGTGILSSEKKDNTVRVTLKEDVTTRTFGFADVSKGTLILRNEGYIRQVITYGTAAAITLENIGLIEGPSGVQLRDERFVDYQRTKSGKITVKNDGIIRGLTGAGMIVAPLGSTTVSISGSGVIEGPVGLVLAANCVNGKAQVTINHQLRTCLSSLEAQANTRQDFWLELKTKVNQLSLPTPTDEEALTVAFQQKVRQAQLDQILGGTGITHEQAMGRALCITQTKNIPYTMTLTLKGTLWGENGLIILPDMKQKKGTLSIQSKIAEDSPSRRIDMVYLKHLLDVNPTTWPKQLSSLMSNSFGGKLPEDVTFHTQTVIPSEQGGAVYSSGWNGPAMMDMSVSRSAKGKWQVETKPLPVPSETPKHGDILQTIAQMPEKSLYRLDSDIQLSSSTYGEDYRAASGPHILDGNGFAFGKASESDSTTDQLYLLKSLTVRNFSVFRGVSFWTRTQFKGELTLQDIASLGSSNIIDMSAHLSRVHLAEDAVLRFSHSESGSRTITLDEDCTFANGWLELSCSPRKATGSEALNVVLNAPVTHDRYRSLASISASHGGAVKVTGSGYMGNWENAKPDYGYVDVNVFNGKVTLNHRIAALNINATENSKGSVQVGGQVRHLTVECQDNGSKVSVTVTASQLETFRVLLIYPDRTEPLTDKEAAAFIKKNAPSIKASKATDAQGQKIKPSYQICNHQGQLLWEGEVSAKQ